MWCGKELTQKNCNCTARIVVISNGAPPIHDDIWLATVLCYSTSRYVSKSRPALWIARAIDKRHNCILISSGISISHPSSHSLVTLETVFWTLRNWTNRDAWHNEWRSTMWMFIRMWKWLIGVGTVCACEYSFKWQGKDLAQ